MLLIRNIKVRDYFHSKEVDPKELMLLLLGYFNRSANISERRYRFQTNGEARFVDVELTKSGSIKTITFSDGFPAKVLEEIEKEILHTLITSHRKVVGRVVAFCDEEITGYFRYKDLFQIVLVSERSPKPSVVVADHPFILEVSYTKCSNASIDIMRRMEKAYTYSRLLNQLSNCRVWLGTRYAQFSWVLEKEDSPELVTSEWKQNGYVAKDIGNSEEFTLTDGLETIKLTDPAVYYSVFGRSSSSFTLADNIDTSLDKAFLLSKDNWNKFFMACSWFAQFYFTWKESHSSAFIALVTALECLAQERSVCKACNQPIMEDADFCDACGQPIFRITAGFKKFLEKYFPDIDSFPNEKKTIYLVRSQLAHGMNLLQADLEPWNFAMDNKQDEERILQDHLFRIVRTAIYNWLQES